MIAMAFGGCLLIGAVVGFLGGFTTDTKQEVAKHLRANGFTKEGVKLYGRAAKILRRLDGITELDGDFAADILSPETKKQVSEWLADYRNEINKV